MARANNPYADVAFFVDHTVEILGLAADFDVCLVHAPTRADRSFPLTEGCFQDWHQLKDPAVDRGMVDLHAAFLHHLFDIPQTQGVGHVPADAYQHDLQGKPQPLYRQRARSNPVTRQNSPQPPVRRPERCASVWPLPADERGSGARAPGAIR